MKHQFFKSIFVLSLSSLALFSCSNGESALSDNRYAGVLGDQWGCHDPKLFQDDDGTYYVYSTGWADGVQIRKSKDAQSWEKIDKSPLSSDTSVSDVYDKMYWDDDFLKWTGCITNEGKRYSTAAYHFSSRAESWAPTVIKQDGKYYMFHGIVKDCQTVGKTAHRAGCITLAISDSPTGAFIPASKYDSSLYAQSSLVRCVWSNKKNKSPEEIGYQGSFNSCDENWNKGFGTIDPEFVMDVATGELYKTKIGERDCYAMTYGSWLGGIALVYVDAKTLKGVCTKAGVSTFDGRHYEVGDELDCPLDSIEGNQGVKIAGGSGAAYEGAQVIFNSDTGYFYVFVSMGNLFHEYRVGVGRSSDIEGPYLDTSGVSMSFSTASDASKYHNVGGKILGAWQFGENAGDEYGFRAPGGQSILRDNGGHILLSNHTRTNYFPTGNFALQVHQMFFTTDGWPVLNINDFAGEAAALQKISKRDIAGKYLCNITRRAAHNDFIETTDGNTVEFNAADERESLSKLITLSSGGKISGAYTGSWTTDGNGNITISLYENGEFAGEFEGIVMKARDNARKEGKNSITTTFSSVCAKEEGSHAGEYLFGNKI